MNARPEGVAKGSISKKPIISSTSDKSDADADLARARDLVQLHHAVKVAAVNGEIQKELSDIRQSVRDAAGIII